jgi:hypothetical protein
VACVTRTMRDEALVAIAHVADTHGWEFAARRSSVELRSPDATQLWRIDAPWTPDTTVSVAVRPEAWLLAAPSVRVELVGERLMVVEGCRRFSVAGCEAGWHNDKPCNGHAYVSMPDPFSFERFIQAVMAGRIECAYIDGLIDPVESPEQRWGGWMWMPSEDADLLRDWQGDTAPAVAAPVVAHEIAPA